MVYNISKTGFLVFALTLFIATNLVGQQFDTADHSLLTSQIDSIVLEGIMAKAYPGAQIFIAKDGQTIINKSYGFHTYDQELKVENKHLYDLASITKVTTGLPLLMQLYADKKFDLNASLKNYIPEFKNSNKGALIIRDILAHQARLEPYIVYWQKTLRKK